MERITQKDLEYLVKRINEVTGSPISTCTKRVDDRGSAFGHQYSWNIGNYHLDYAYGGVKLSQMVSEGGGITNISDMGYGTKRELYNWMRAFLAGIELRKS